MQGYAKVLVSTNYNSNIYSHPPVRLAPPAPPPPQCHCCRYCNRRHRNHVAADAAVVAAPAVTAATIVTAATVLMLPPLSLQPGNVPLCRMSYNQ